MPDIKRLNSAMMRIKNAEEGLKKLMPEIYACIVVTIVAIGLGICLSPILYWIAAIAAGNAAGKIIFLRKGFHRIISHESLVIAQYKESAPDPERSDKKTQEEER